MDFELLFPTMGQINFINKKYHGTPKKLRDKKINESGVPLYTTIKTRPASLKMRKAI